MQYIEAANHWTGREGQTPRFIILHATAGGTTAVETANYFASQPQDPNTGSSANYVVGQAGDVVMCVKEEDAPWANGPLTAGHDALWDSLNGVNPNLVSIAIEHDKPSVDNSDSLTDAQQTTSFSLIEDICNRWNIPKRWADSNGGITGHYSLDPVNRSRCPGPYPWDALFSYLNRQIQPAEEDMLQLSDPLGKYFSQAGVTKWLLNKTKIYIGGAILVYYRITNGAARLPRGNEQYNIKGVVWQPFEAGIMVYDPQALIDNPPNAHNHTYMLKTDSDLAQQILNAPLQATLKKAQDAATQAQSALQVAQAQIVTLGKELSEAKAAQPVDQAQLKIDLTNASAAITDAMTLFK